MSRYVTGTDVSGINEPHFLWLLYQMSAVLIMLIVLAAIFIIWVFYPGSTKEEKFEEQKFEEQKPVESHKVEDVVPTQECIIACQDSEKPDDCIKSVISNTRCESEVPLRYLMNSFAITTL